MDWKNSPLVIHKITSLFLNELTVNDRHYPLNRDNLTQPIQMQLSEKHETLSQFFFFCIFKIYIKFYTFPKKKMTLVADVFLEIPAPKNMLR